MAGKTVRFVREEGAVALGFLLAAGAWFVLLRWAVPYAYGILNRFGVQDYSYLWDGFSTKTAWWAGVGAATILGLLPVWIGVRIFRRVMRLIMRPPATTARKAKGWASVLMKEVLIFAGIVLVGGIVFYVTRGECAVLKARYFNEVVMNRAEYRGLSPTEKATARVQYEAATLGADLGGMFDDYGPRARALYYLQIGAFWVLLWGWPTYLLARFVFWALGKLRVGEQQ